MIDVNLEQKPTVIPVPYFGKNTIISLIYQIHHLKKGSCRVRNLKKIRYIKLNDNISFGM